MHFVRTWVIGLVFIGSGAGSASAACEPMVLHSVPSTVQWFFADLDESGAPSAGDKRSGEVDLTHDDGTPAGRQLWAGTVRAVDTDGNATEVEGESIYDLDGGLIFATDVFEPAVRMNNLNETVISHPEEWLITGGTGDFANASGIVTVAIDGMQFRHELELSCEG